MVSAMTFMLRAVKNEAVKFLLRKWMKVEWTLETESKKTTNANAVFGLMINIFKGY